MTTEQFSKATDLNREIGNIKHMIELWDEFAQKRETMAYVRIAGHTLESEWIDSDVISTIKAALHRRLSKLEMEFEQL